MVEYMKVGQLEIRFVQKKGYKYKYRQPKRKFACSNDSAMAAHPHFYTQQRIVDEADAQLALDSSSLRALHHPQRDQEVRTHRCSSRHAPA